jgi:hypothetical protein
MAHVFTFTNAKGGCGKTTVARLRREREKKLPMMIFLVFVLHMRKRLATAGTNPIPKPITSTVSQRSR